MDAGSIPRSTAAVSTNVLKVDPGWRRACERRLNWLFVLPGTIAVIARMAPLAGSMDTIAAAGSVLLVRVSLIAFCASRCQRGSSVV